MVIFLQFLLPLLLSASLAAAATKPSKFQLSLLSSSARSDEALLKSLLERKANQDWSARMKLLEDLGGELPGLRGVVAEMVGSVPESIFTLFDKDLLHHIVRHWITPAEYLEYCRHAPWNLELSRIVCDRIINHNHQQPGLLLVWCQSSKASSSSHWQSTRSA
jgi:hypothetical protein